MKKYDALSGCGALQIDSKIPVNQSSVKAVIDQAFAEVRPQETFTVTQPPDVDEAVAFAENFFKEHLQPTKVMFLIIDMFLLKAETASLKRLDPLRPEQLAWQPDAAEFRDRFLHYGEIRSDGSYHQDFGTKCLSSVYILQKLWRILRPGVIVVFNAGRVRIAAQDLGPVCAGLANEGVAWLYTEQDEREEGVFFTNYLRLLFKDVEGTLPKIAEHR